MSRRLILLVLLLASGDVRAASALLSGIFRGEFRRFIQGGGCVKPQRMDVCGFHRAVRGGSTWKRLHIFST